VNTFYKIVWHNDFSCVPGRKSGDGLKSNFTAGVEVSAHSPLKTEIISYYIARGGDARDRLSSALVSTIPEPPAEDDP
jgi:hypothetical protein